MYALDEMTLVELVERGATHYQDRPALSMIGGDGFSYAQLEQASAAFAQKLLAYGVEDGDRVALLAENSPYWGAAYFAILKAGAVAVPILVDFNPDQIANILKHSGAKAVICSDKLEPKLKPSLGSLAVVGVTDGKLKHKGPAKDSTLEKPRDKTSDKTGASKKKPA